MNKNILEKIKPGMIIHCQSRAEQDALYDILCEIGHMSKYTIDSRDHFTNTNITVDDYEIKDLSGATWGFVEHDSTSINFSDLVDGLDDKTSDTTSSDKSMNTSDLDLSAAEVLHILGKIANCSSRECQNCNFCVLSSRNTKAEESYCTRPANFLGNEEEIIEICKRWKLNAAQTISAV